MPIGLLPSPDKLGPSPTEEFRRQRSGKGSKLQEGEELQVAQKRGVETETGGAAQVGPRPQGSYAAGSGRAPWPSARRPARLP